MALARYEMHTIEVVVDRLIRRDNIRQRLTESIETALELTGGTAEVLVMNGTDGGESDEAITFSQHLACTHCGISFEEPAPRNFSFNSPYGACPVCLGLGTNFEVDPELVVPDDSLSLAEGALAPWAGARSEYFTGLQAGVAELRRLLLRHPVEVAQGQGQEAGPLRHRQPGRARHLQEPLQPHAAPTRRTTRASSRGCSGATASRSPTGRASRSSSTCARWTAPSATGPASSPSRWP